MAVPAHDSRDYAFAKHFKLPIPQVVSGGDISEESYDAKEGKLINSGFLDGLDVKEGIRRAIEEIEKKNLGKGKTNYRLRDAAFGRQRYWGEPIPVYYKDGIPYTLEEKDLPLVLPEIDSFLPTESGEPPLGRAKDWKYKGQYSYETTTMPGWAGSSWYYLRYMDAHNDQAFASPEAMDYWKNVDLYIGGSEHATGHLLYVRFWTKFLKDRGFVKVEEPAQKLINQGMIQGTSCFVYRLDAINTFLSAGLADAFLSKPKNEGITILKQLLASNNITGSEIEAFEKNPTLSKLHADVNIVTNNELDTEKFRAWREEFKNAKFILEDGKYICAGEVEKMSKSKHNVVSPDLVCEQFGADCLRLYEMFLGPLEQSKPWNTNGITGVSGFIRKLWKLYHDASFKFIVSDEPASKAELKSLHRSIKKVQDDMERYSFNTSVSNFMICVNELTELKCNKRQVLEPLAILVSPYAPHICEELWKLLGHSTSITFARFPVYEEKHTVETAFNYPVSLNGKTKFFIELDLSLSKESIEKEVLAQEQTQKILDGKAPKKIIVVPNKIVNIVI
jgi:leucyl-tRNA synthetase